MLVRLSYLNRFTASLFHIQYVCVRWCLHFEPRASGQVTSFWRIVKQSKMNVMDDLNAAHKFIMACEAFSVLVDKVW